MQKKWYRIGRKGPNKPYFGQKGSKQTKKVKKGPDQNRIGQNDA